MRLLTFSANDKPRLGVQLGSGEVLDVAQAYARLTREGKMPLANAFTPASFPSALSDLLAQGDAALALAREIVEAASDPDTQSLLRDAGLLAPEQSVTYLPPIPQPSKIVCLGQNYRQHILEMGRPLPEYPVLFAKLPNTLVGHQAPIRLPAISEQADYEGELAIVIGRGGKHIAEADAWSHIAGFTVFNDVSVRDFQRRTTQWMQGKNFDTTGPMGPALVTLDEITHPEALDLTVHLNGEVMQQGNTADFIFPIPAMIAYISQIMTLEPGDIIATGTPGGVGSARTPQVFLRAGDTVSVTISQVGTLRNTVQAAER